MRDSNLGGTSAAPAPPVARLHSQARETVGAVVEIGARLDRLLERLRGATPQAADNGNKQIGAPALDTLLESIHCGATRAHDLLSEIECLV